MNEQEAKAIVLEWLTDETDDRFPIATLANFDVNFIFNDKTPFEVKSAYNKLSIKSQYELLAEFAEWGLKGSAE
ncbi:hypothetical protein [Listeria monocytogenes]|uniref:Uncharacterized protein n=1 Tax=Listeria monocytogenes TaxID=1639 RepID=A0A6C8MZZ0_LISMN|nr:hypothetical protein [Listeria monocytogenes]KAA9534108.1 hypothetical protein DCK33_08180 [Listeria monocytogenes]KAA9541467.1 hypothetical protein DCK32_10285 [Listeria monocytogenes]